MMLLLPKLPPTENRAISLLNSGDVFKHSGCYYVYSEMREDNAFTDGMCATAFDLIDNVLIDFDWTTKVTLYPRATLTL